MVAVAILTTACYHGPGRADHGDAQQRREQVVEMARSGSLTQHDENGDLVLPTDLADLTVYGVVTVRGDGSMVFFLTETFFSPDPYCGYEYATGRGRLR